MCCRPLIKLRRCITMGNTHQVRVWSEDYITQPVLPSRVQISMNAIQPSPYCATWIPRAGTMRVHSTASHPSVRRVTAELLQRCEWTEPAAAAGTYATAPALNTTPKLHLMRVQYIERIAPSPEIQASTQPPPRQCGEGYTPKSAVQQLM